MVLDFIQGYLDGDSWEKLIDLCYMDRYENDGYQKLYATDGGDGGIEGFTHTGIVYQCYCPERDFSDADLYKHLRTKMTDDINKLIDEKYAARLKGFGIKLIREWHLVVPEYKDANIIHHAATKTSEVLNCKKLNPMLYDYISDDFKIIVKVAENFRLEITRIVRNELTDVKLNLAVKHSGEIDWTKCDSQKVENIKRKVKAVMGDVEDDDEDFRDVVSGYIEYYIKGIELFNKLRISFSEVYEQIASLEKIYKKQVSMKTKMNTDSSINSKLFNEILNDFENKLKDEFKYLAWDSILELKQDIISGWLADCSMQFKTRGYKYE